MLTFDSYSKANPSSMKKVKKQTTFSKRLAKDTGSKRRSGPERVESLESTVSRQELTDFLRENCCDHDVCLRQWWKENETRFPTLARIFWDLCIIQSSSSESERLFSRAGFVVNNLRCSLNEDTTQALVCLNAWLDSGFEVDL
ncbi:hypothetical protein GEMRC1_001917 [Eukaryota sp. GEM-RC1]